MKKLRVLWCNLAHGDGQVKRDSLGRINWQCSKCGRWMSPVTPEEEASVVEADKQMWEYARAAVAQQAAPAYKGEPDMHAYAAQQRRTQSTMIPTSNQLELDLFPEGAIVAEGTLANWEEVSSVSTFQEANHAVQRPEGPVN